MRTNRIVCLDTNILCGAYGTGRSDNAEFEEKSLALVESLSKEKAKVFIPSIVLAESMAHLDDDVAKSYFDEITKIFPIAHFDSIASTYYRIIYRAKKPMLCTYEGYSRCNQSADIKIIATAMGCGAECIYTENKDFARCAEDFIKTLPLPPLPPKQLMLPM